jgi:hypothetical protein
MVSRDKPAAAEYGARRGLAGSNRELQAPRESVVLNSSLERAIFCNTIRTKDTGVFRGNLLLM